MNLYLMQQIYTLILHIPDKKAKIKAINKGTTKSTAASLIQDMYRLLVLSYIKYIGHVQIFRFYKHGSSMSFVCHANQFSSIEKEKNQAVGCELSTLSRNWFL